jgi:hypothetical protein
MRLVSIGVDNYKRFVEPSELRCDGKLVAIVGPNEAGKSSLLQALTHLTSREPFTEDEHTRGHARRNPARMVWARYLIEQTDRDRMPGLGVEGARWYVYGLSADGKAFHDLEGVRIRRDLSGRAQAVALLLRAAEHRVFKGEEGEPLPVAVQASKVAADLGTAGQSLGTEMIDSLREFAEEWPGRTVGGAPKYMQTLGEVLAALADEEEKAPPQDVALSLLYEQRPQFLLFGEEERDLRSDYDLLAEADSPPVALRNLARLASLDLTALREALETDKGLATKMLEDANRELVRVFDESWRQSGVYLRLDTDEYVLRVFISAPERYTSIAERSDGLRAFLALLTFTRLHASTGVKPILLVDEAETHLHYDAQADLIRVFTKQDAAVKVIYTTHSAGCLPEDLGVGVRVVVPDGETAASRIENSFWAGGPGFSPLLIGMGASAFSFASTRHAVFVEGGSDVVLLPTLMREATGLESLDFQVTPGLAEILPLNVPLLDREGGRVAYLVDNDADGRKITRKLEQGGVPAERVITVGKGSDVRTPEDLLGIGIYLLAINAELERSHGPSIQMTDADIPSRDRAAAVAAWCKQAGLSDAPSKVGVAYRVLDLAAEGRKVVQTDRLVSLRRTYLALLGALGIEQPPR